MAVRLSALRTGRALLRNIIFLLLVLILLEAEYTIRPTAAVRIG
jgi:hypothetical protein